MPERKATRLASVNLLIALGTNFDNGGHRIHSEFVYSGPLPLKLVLYCIKIVKNLTLKKIRPVRVFEGTAKGTPNSVANIA